MIPACLMTWQLLFASGSGRPQQTPCDTYAAHQPTPKAQSAQQRSAVSPLPWLSFCSSLGISTVRPFVSIKTSDSTALVPATGTGAPDSEHGSSRPTLIMRILSLLPSGGAAAAATAPAGRRQRRASRAAKAGLLLTPWFLAGWRSCWLKRCPEPTSARPASVAHRIPEVHTNFSRCS